MLFNLIRVSVGYSADIQMLQSISTTLFKLTTRPSYHAELRAEIQQCLELHGGWTLEALDAMILLDSFIKESQRHRPMSNGIHLLPAGPPPPSRRLPHMH